MSNVDIKKSVAALGMGSALGLSALVGAPTAATAAQVTAYDCKTVTKKIDSRTAVREKSCIKQISTVIPLWQRVVVSRHYVYGGHWV